MINPDKPAKVSISGAGDVSEVPDSADSFVTYDKEGNPDSLLEKWDSETWIWASVESLIQIKR